jgi:hypothetical protein
MNNHSIEAPGQGRRCRNMKLQASGRNDYEQAGSGTPEHYISYVLTSLLSFFLTYPFASLLGPTGQHNVI